MFEAVAFTYTFLASFVLASAERNRRAKRPHARPLLLAGWLVMAASITLGLLLIGRIVWNSLVS